MWGKVCREKESEREKERKKGEMESKENKEGMASSFIKAVFGMKSLVYVEKSSEQMG